MRKIIYKVSSRSKTQLSTYLLRILPNKKLVLPLGVVLVLIICICAAYILLSSRLRSDLGKQAQLHKKPIPTYSISSKIQKYPLTLSIPKLSIRAPVEPVGLDKEGNMDVPKDPQHVAWYERGAAPGNVGSMVLAGHVDDKNGKPAIFSNLSTLKKGDVIRVTNMANQSFEYIVSKKASYPYDSAPLKDIFGETKEAHLNLITCSGTWDDKTQNYSNREVVYAVLKE